MTTRKVVIPDWLPAQLANGAHGHWADRRNKLREAQTVVWTYAKLHGLEGFPPTQRARLTITLVFPNHRRRDTDNLYARVKGCVDGLVHGGWIVDDSTEHLDLIVRAMVVPGEKATILELSAADE